MNIDTIPTQYMIGITIPMYGLLNFTYSKSRIMTQNEKRSTD